MARSTSDGLIKHGATDSSGSICSINSDGEQEWLKDGVLHRIDGPAILHANGMEEWFLHGKRHRVDGPAIIRAEGDISWWWNGWCCTFDNWLAKTPFDEEQKLLLKLQYG